MWTNNAIKALINVCLEKRDVYHSFGSNRKKWRKISNRLFEAGFVYHPDKCKERMEELRKEYLDYDVKAQRTGAPGLAEMIQDPRTREFMLLMEELWTDSVVVKPKIVISAGLSSKIVRSSVSVPPEWPQ